MCSSLSPFQGRTAKSVAVGVYHTCAILDDDSLKCWGYNSHGNLGLGDTTNRHYPTAVNLGTVSGAAALGQE